MTTIAIPQELKEHLAKLGGKSETYADIITNLISQKKPCSNGEFKEAHIPDTGRIRLTEAAGKTIVWRVKE